MPPNRAQIQSTNISELNRPSGIWHPTVYQWQVTSLFFFHFLMVIYRIHYQCTIMTMDSKAGCIYFYMYPIHHEWTVCFLCQNDCLAETAPG